ncbi:MAG: Ig-like domain-containing protein, partial [Candidatus Riflebacteria bacterium]|nr:Ig-like domain-containing protein [Candidatus Riflebacteria bacterium]
KVDKGFSVYFAAPVATSSEGLGLFNLSGNTWKFITSDLNQAMAYSARLTSSQMLAVMRDVVAPTVALDKKIDLDEPFRVSRPEFSGEIKEAGSGLAAQEVVAHIDGGLAQPVIVDGLGRFSFKPFAELTTGDHELVIKAADKTGNKSQTAAMRFQVQLPLQIGQIMQYPNPASRRGYIRISANSGALNDDLVSIKIYDTAGHKVTTLSNVKAVKENFGAGSSRFLYDILWDLRNDAGKQVANGVYLARIEVRDPINPANKVKKTCKLAVLR